MARRRRRKRKARRIPVDDLIFVQISRLERTRHVRRCVLCKEILSMCPMADNEYVRSALNIIKTHIRKNPNPSGIACSHAGCVRHERVTHDFARRLEKVSQGTEGWFRDIRGVLATTFPLEISKDSPPPEGFDLKKADAIERRFKDLPTAPGDVYIRLGPKIAMVHIWVSPSYASRHENSEDPATLRDVVKTYEAMEPLKQWCIEKYEEYKTLAEMEAQFAEDDTKEE